jgi:hypothetical protein
MWIAWLAAAAFFLGAVFGCIVSVSIIKWGPRPATVTAGGRHAAKQTDRATPVQRRDSKDVEGVRRQPPSLPANISRPQ